MNDLEFDDDHLPVPRPGLTSAQAYRLMRAAFPRVRRWICWNLQDPEAQISLGKIPLGNRARGQIGSWTWARVPCGYPTLGYWAMDPSRAPAFDRWTGAIRVRNPQGREFLLFSYVSTTGTIGGRYLASTTDTRLLGRFADACVDHFRTRRNRIHILVVNGPDISLDPDEDEAIFLPEDLQQDIEGQVDAFFRHPEAYKRLGIPHRRGLLFVGPPGTGKTMMVRRILRRVWPAFKPNIMLLRPSKEIEEQCLHQAFCWPSDTPTILILEDMDAITRESRLTRASLLAHLDGIKPARGGLVIGTTNNPEDVDPALMHRPSRFDRVWLFDVPGEALRLRYMRQTFPEVTDAVASELASRTANWSFAYLNELRTTAAVLSINQGAVRVGEEHLRRALELLSAQFDAGTKNHALPPQRPKAGFQAA